MVKPLLTFSPLRSISVSFPFLPRLSCPFSPWLLLNVVSTTWAVGQRTNSWFLGLVEPQFPQQLSRNYSHSSLPSCKITGTGIPPGGAGQSSECTPMPFTASLLNLSAGHPVRDKHRSEDPVRTGLPDIVKKP